MADSRLLTQQDLRDVYNALYPARAKWWALGIELGLSHADLTEIEDLHREHARRMEEMLNRWLKKRLLNPNWQSLIAALKKETVGEEGVADEVEKMPKPSPVMTVDYPPAEAGAVIAAGSLHPHVVSKLATSSNVSRAIGIGISNETGMTWTCKGTWLDFTTTSNVTLPDVVKHGEALLYTAKKFSGMPCIGIMGVLIYEMSDQNTFAAIFRVPYNYMIANNWWNVKVFAHNEKPESDEKVFDALFKNSARPAKGNDNWVDMPDIGQGYKARGVMSSSGTPPLVIHVGKQ